MLLGCKGKLVKYLLPTPTHILLMPLYHLPSCTEELKGEAAEPILHAAAQHRRWQGGWWVEEGREGPEAAFRMRIRKFPVVILNQYFNKGFWCQYYCNLRPWQISSEWISAICCWISFNSRKNDLGRVWDNFSCTLLLSLPFLAPWGEVDIMFFTGDHRELFRLQVRIDINLDSRYSSEKLLMSRGETLKIENPLDFPAG